MNSELDYKKIEGAIADGVVTNEEFDMIMDIADSGDRNHAHETHGQDADGDVIIVTKINDYQWSYVRTARKGPRNEIDKGVFAYAGTKDPTDGTITIKKLY